MENQKKENIILIVDDNKLNLQILGSNLREVSFRVAVLKEGKFVLNMAKKIKPDLILLDIMMPEMDGYEVCEQLKADISTKEIPVIFLTAKTDTQDIVKGFTTGAVDYITKPFKKEELLARVQNHIDLENAKRLVKNQAHELSQLNKSKDILFSIIAHDLRNPLGGFKGMLELLKDDVFLFNSQEYKDAIKLLINTANDVSNLLENLLFWSRSQRDEVRFIPQNLELNKIIFQNISLLQGVIRKKKIQINYNVTEVSVLYADKEMVKVIIRNILSNAVKFTDVQGCIDIFVSTNNNIVKIKIKDNGIGMSSDIVEKIFDEKKFDSRFGTDGEKGSGLGLNLCQLFVNKNNGNIEVKSEENIGSEFIITLPSVSSI